MRTVRPRDEAALTKVGRVALPQARVRLGEYVASGLPPSRPPTCSAPSSSSMPTSTSSSDNPREKRTVVVPERSRTEARHRARRRVTWSAPSTSCAERSAGLPGREPALLVARRRERTAEFVRTFGHGAGLRERPGARLARPRDPTGSCRRGRRAQARRRGPHLRHAARLPHRLRPRARTSTRPPS